MPAPITNTLEVLAAIFVVSEEFKKSKADDGKTSWWEAAQIVMRSRKEVMDAINGINQVLPELLDADTQETDALTAAVSGILNLWGVPHRIQDLPREFLDDALRLAQSLARILNRPPSAEPV